MLKKTASRNTSLRVISFLLLLTLLLGQLSVFATAPAEDGMTAAQETEAALAPLTDPAPNPAADFAELKFCDNYGKPLPVDKQFSTATKEYTVTVLENGYDYKSVYVQGVLPAGLTAADYKMMLVYKYYDGTAKQDLVTFKAAAAEDASPETTQKSAYAWPDTPLQVSLVRADDANNTPIVTYTVRAQSNAYIYSINVPTQDGVLVKTPFTKFDGYQSSADKYDPDAMEVYVDDYVKYLRLTLIWQSKHGHEVTLNGQKVENNKEYLLELSKITFTGGKAVLPIIVSDFGNCNGRNDITVTLLQMPQPEAPEFLRQPTQPERFPFVYVLDDDLSRAEQNRKIQYLEVLASAGGQVTYQWYKNTENKNTGGTPVQGSTGVLPVPTAKEIGPGFWYCVATNTKTGKSTATEAVPFDIYAKPELTANIETVIPDLPKAWEQLFDGQTKGFYYCMGDTDLTPIVYKTGGKNIPEVWLDAYGSYDAAAKDSKGYQVYNHTVAMSGKRIVDETSMRTMSAQYPQVKQAKADRTTATLTPTVDQAYGKSIYKQTYKVRIYNTDYLYNDYLYELPLPDVYVYVNAKGAVPTDFKAMAEGHGWAGSGTAESPWILADKQDLEELRTEINTNRVNFYRKYFKLGADMDLGNWTPIGACTVEGVDNNGRPKSGNGKNMIPFSGTLDGGGHTLTFAEGSKPLLFYARKATIKNLNIYAPYMDASGLIEYYVVDYGADGNYNTEVPWTAEINNVTIKSGSVIKGSGYASGYASGKNSLNITNCKVEQDVKIGCVKSSDGTITPQDTSYVGSFAGDFNGNITNCVSYADVYGKNYVGGIAGSKGQSMGDCTVMGSSFFGTVTATGTYVGGIFGGGYNDASAPSTPCVSVYNCFVAPQAVVTGGNKVGGIFGGEGGSMNAPRNGIGIVRDNLFTGKVSATGVDVEKTLENGEKATVKESLVGGIFGFMRSLSEYNYVSGNLYIEGAAAEGFGAIEILKSEYHPMDTQADRDKLTKTVTAAQLKNGTALKILNDSPTSLKNWVQSGDTPAIGSKPVAYRLTISGEYQTEYYLGDDLDFTGMVLTADWTNGEVTTPAAKDIRVSGYSKNTRGFQTVTLTYGAGSAKFDVTVLKRPTTGSNTITVSFTMLGDSIHGEDGDSHTLSANNLATWMETTSVTVGINDTVWDVIRKACGSNYKFNTNEGLGTVYIAGITPRGDLELKEFTNGPNSGWMYTINNRHSLLGVAQQYLNNGDKIVLHYTDDYTVESGSDQWGAPGSSDGAAGDTGKSTVTEIKTETKVENGKATVTADSAALNKALESAEANTQLVIKTEVKAGETVNETTAVLKGADVAAIAKRGVALKVNSPVADIVLSGEALKGLDTTAQVSVTAAKTEQGTRVEVAVGDKAVEKLSGNLTVNLPVAKAELTPGSVMVLVDENGKETIIKKSAVGDDGVVALLKGSCTVKIVDKSKAFEDAGNHWAKDNIAFAASHDLFQGTGENSFAPNAAMDRGMLATVLYRLEDAKANGTSAFGDVKSDAYYADAVTWANSNAIVSGTGKGFEPERAVTRQELVKMIYSYAKSVGMDTGKTVSLSKYGDAGKVAGWASEPMAWAVANGIVSGRDGSSLAPTGTATRAEVAAIMQRLVGLMVK